MAGKITVFEEDGARIVRVGPMGPGNNNGYIVKDTSSGDALLVDMPLDDGTLLEAIASEGGVRRVVATHWHHDHWMSYDAVRRTTAAPVFVGDKEVRIPAERIDGRLADGEEIRIGSLRLAVVHTPGHTPGSICLRLGKAVISGDTLMNGGPGKTFSRGDLETLIASIGSRLLPLPDETILLPGHGEETTIGSARHGYADYQKHPKPPGYYGDVSWIS